MKLDRIDKHILSLLQKDAQMSNQTLADQVGLSPSPCLRRVKQLEDAGYIHGYVALLNPSQLDLKLTAYVQIALDRHTPDRFAAFDAVVTQCPEVVECFLVTGQTADYTVKVVVPDMEAYQDFLLNTLTQIPGVTGVHSSFVMRKVVDKTQLPLKYLK
ncbi:Lrp/AsnC family transcriptional regulator, leucine-responsive regulatory protein [Allopseudospirillum japonicum]|uniref:Lrp/AsnC family transcriptional regulator, leucine-responsive regulatory protein n=1 Tax=Allopseudospirillum japonicum TaxID=64971 RepID=A0A1H6S8K8_9GAMM|nr:Lrp/AsnC family transcriptional regulator [Allopseudospirillum japonicum]SEI64219.1 Lrp/AsnC family transcriptional regulator, leucine-responsive regulatory protein [Allopseudospirillum japonicum]